MTNLAASTPAPPGEESTSINCVFQGHGTIYYDFGSEACRQTFQKWMDAAVTKKSADEAVNPDDLGQMLAYLAHHPLAATSLIWILNVESKPTYVIEPRGSFAHEAYLVFQELLTAQLLPPKDKVVEEISISGFLTGQTIELISGQTLPVLKPRSTYGLYGWKIRQMVCLMRRSPRSWAIQA